MRAALVGFALTSLLCGAFPSVAAAGAAREPTPVGPGSVGEGERATVALLGDSLIEGGYLARPEFDAVGPQLRIALARAGIDPGGRGFLPAHVTSFVPVAPPGPLGPVRYTGSWTASSGTVPGALSVLESYTRQPGAEAWLRSRGDTVAVLLGAGPTSFRARIQTDTGRSTLATAPARGPLSVTWIATKRGGRVAVKNRQGRLSLLGFLERRDTTARPQVEVSVMARSGARAADWIGPLDEAGLRALAPRLTVLAYGTNDALAAAAGDGRALERMSAGLGRLARLARRSGACVVVLPPRFAATAAVAVEVATRQRRVAAAHGCRVVASAERALDPPGLRGPDGLHPSPAGARRLAETLLPALTGR